MRLENIVLVSFFFPALLVAIDCAELSQRESFREAVAVFQGEVTKVQEVRQIINASGPHLATFKVDRMWKGPVTQTMMVFAPGHMPTGDGGYTFHEGQRYIVYATSNYPLDDSDQLQKLGDGKVVHGIGIFCRLRVVPGSDIAKESRLLGEGRRPMPDPVKK